MTIIKALLSDNWTLHESTNTPLEPLELNKLEQGIIIARMKKLAKDPQFNFANALELVHRSYEQQDWERQGTYGDFIRPKPSDRKAWTQYEEMIQNAVKLLSKFRGINGDWRTDRFVTVPTNDRASMGSMAAASIGENWVLSTTTPITLFENVGITDAESFVLQLEQYCEHNSLILTEGECTASQYTLYLYNLDATLQNTIHLKKSS